MKILLLSSILVFTACTPDAGNTTAPAATPLEVVEPVKSTSSDGAAPLDSASASGENSSDVKPSDAVGVASVPVVDTVLTSDSIPTPVSEPIMLAGCTDSSTANSDHKINVTVDEGTGKYKIDFLNDSDRAHRVISLYVTDVNDDIPTFTNGFKFSGTAYWMVSLDDPFETYFNLPILYGELKTPGVDVTARYKGLADGKKLEALTDATCLKVSVLTFEPEEVQSFKTSTFLLTHRP